METINHRERQWNGRVTCCFSSLSLMKKRTISKATKSKKRQGTNLGALNCSGRLKDATCWKHSAAGLNHVRSWITAGALHKMRAAFRQRWWTNRRRQATCKVRSCNSIFKENHLPVWAWTRRSVCRSYRIESYLRVISRRWSSERPLRPQNLQQFRFYGQTSRSRRSPEQKAVERRLQTLTS